MPTDVKRQHHTRRTFQPLSYQQIHHAHLGVAANRRSLDNGQQLQQPHLPRRRLRVTQTGLGSAHCQRSRSDSVNGGKSARLGRVAQWCARAVRFNAPHRHRRE